MKITLLRISSIVSLLLLGAGGHFALSQHLEIVNRKSLYSLTKPLDLLPHQLGHWTGSDKPIRKEALIGDDHLLRVYRHNETGMELQLWIVYSAEGENRRHHPLVCMAVDGKEEIASERKSIGIDEHSTPIQQFCFKTSKQPVWVYYWNYDMLPQHRELSSLQKLYRKIQRRFPSVTLEVFIDEHTPGTREAVIDFVKLVDSEIHPWLGPGAVRDSRYMRVSILDN